MQYGECLQRVQHYDGPYQTDSYSRFGAAGNISSVLSLDASSQMGGMSTVIRESGGGPCMQCPSSQMSFAPSSRDRASTSDKNDAATDETLAERIWGLTEMVPQPIRRVTGAVVSATATGLKGLYRHSCNISWMVFTSTMILTAPVLFELGRNR